MGLMVAEDGRYQGWLATFLCCCAAINEDENPCEKEKAWGVCTEQPQILTPISPDADVLTLNAFKGDEPIVDGTRQKLRKVQKSPTVNTPDTREKRSLGSWFDDSRSQPLQPQRPTISAPYAFRRLDHSDSQRQGLVPLRLGPVVLRDSPMAAPERPVRPSPSLQPGHERHYSAQALFDDNGRPLSYRASRETPFDRCQPRSPALQQLESPREKNSMPGTISQPAPAKLSGSAERKSSEHRRQGSGSDASPTNTRSPGERNPRRKRSLPFMRRPSTDDGERLEQEILELNTIVEERKAEHKRANSLDQHTPAVAPGMAVHARSETLDSIGSALSRPLTSQSKGDPTTPERRRIKRSASSTSFASSRFSGWLSGVLPSSSPTAYQNDRAPYKPQPHHRHFHSTHSQASTYTFGTELESPALTASGHSRSYTDESRMMTPLSPSSEHSVRQQRSRVLSKTDREELEWPMIATPSAEVGIAF